MRGPRQEDTDVLTVAAEAVRAYWGSASQPTTLRRYETLRPLREYLYDVNRRRQEPARE